MTNDLIPQDADGRVDDILDRALRQIAGEDRGDIAWPADEATLAYLKGEANEVQRVEVQAVLAQSAEYRRFLTDTEEMVRTADSERGASAFDATAHAGETAQRRGVAAPALRRPWWELLLRPVVWIPVAAVAALLIWFGSRPQVPAGPQTIAFAPYEQLDAADFVPFDTRGTQPATTDTGVYATAESAAVRVFQACITLNASTMTYDIEPQSRRIAPNARTHSISLALSDTTTHQVINATSNIPATLPFDSAEITAWLMVPPSTTLYQVRIPTTSVSADWPAATHERGCLTFSYRVDGGYRASPGQVITF